VLALATHLWIPTVVHGHAEKWVEFCLLRSFDRCAVIKFNSDIVFTFHDQVTFFSIINDDLAQVVHSSRVQSIKLSGLSYLSYIQNNCAICILLFNTALARSREIKLVNVLSVGGVECFTVITEEIASGDAMHFFVDFSEDVQLEWILHQVMNFGYSSVFTDYIGLQWNNVSVLDMSE